MTDNVNSSLPHCDYSFPSPAQEGGGGKCARITFLFFPIIPMFWFYFFLSKSHQKLSNRLVGQRAGFLKVDCLITSSVFKCLFLFSCIKNHIFWSEIGSGFWEPCGTQNFCNIDVYPHALIEWCCLLYRSSFRWILVLCWFKQRKWTSRNTS